MAQSDQLHQIISALEQFQTLKNSLFSLDKLANYLNLSERGLKEVLELVFRFQVLFNSMFKDYILVKKWKNEKTYQILKPKSEVKHIGVVEPKEIEIDKDHVEILNDIVYYFHTFNPILVFLPFSIKIKFLLVNLWSCFRKLFPISSYLFFNILLIFLFMKF